MDAAQERLQALSHTQQALMDKIKALDELDQAGGEPLSCALSPCPHAKGRHASPIHPPQPPLPPITDHGEQRIQEVNTVRLPRAARSRTSLLRRRDVAAPCRDLFSRDSLNPRGTQAPQQQPQDEEALLSMLLQKQAELQKMRAAIDELKTMDAGVTVRPSTPPRTSRMPCSCRFRGVCRVAGRSTQAVAPRP